MTRSLCTAQEKWESKNHGNARNITTRIQFKEKLRLCCPHATACPTTIFLSWTRCLDHLILCDHVEPAKMDYCKKPPLSRRFSIWSDLLVERQLSDSMINALSQSKKAKKVARKAAKALENRMSADPWLPEADEDASDKIVRPGSKRSTKRNKIKKQPIKHTECTLPKKSRKKLNKSPHCKLMLEIASKLEEPRKDLIINVIKTLGDTMTLRFVSETLDVESAGGLLTSNSSRRRTPGGVFFHLIRNSKHVTPQHLNAIFGLDQSRHTGKRKLKKKQAKKLANLADNLMSFNLSGETSNMLVSSPSDQNEASNLQASILEMV